MAMMKPKPTRPDADARKALVDAIAARQAHQQEIDKVARARAAAEEQTYLTRADLDRLMDRSGAAIDLEALIATVAGGASLSGLDEQAQKERLQVELERKLQAWRGVSREAREREAELVDRVVWREQAVKNAAAGVMKAQDWTAVLDGFVGMVTDAARRETILYAALTNGWLADDLAVQVKAALDQGQAERSVMCSPKHPARAALEQVLGALQSDPNTPLPALEMVGAA